MFNKNKFEKPIFSQKEELRALDLLNKSLGLNKLYSEILHRRAIKLVALSGVAGSVYFFEPLHNLYYYKMSSAVANVIANSPITVHVEEVYNAVVSALDYAVPVSAGIFLATGIYCKWASRDRVRYESYLNPDSLIKKGSFDKDKYLKKGEKVLPEIFDEAKFLNTQQQDDVLFAYTKRYVEDRARAKKRKPNKEVRSQEFSDLEKDVLAYSGGRVDYSFDTTKQEKPQNEQGFAFVPASDADMKIDFGEAQEQKTEQPKKDGQLRYIEVDSNLDTTFDNPTQEKKQEKPKKEGIFLDEDYVK